VRKVSLEPPRHRPRRGSPGGDPGAPSRVRCATTPHGLPVKLLVEAAPRRRRLPRALALAALVAATIPAFGRVYGRVRPQPAGALAPAAPVRPAVPVEAPRPPAAATVNRVIQLEAAAPPDRAADVAAGGGAHVEVIAPSGARTRVPAFRKGAGLAARVRPREPGLHRWRMLDGDGEGVAQLAGGSFQAADAQLPGQVVVRGAALVSEDGRPFHPLGENRFKVYDPAWSDGLAAEAYVARMAGDGMNTLGVFVFTACGRAGTPAKPGCLEPSLGRFDEGAAAAYDAIFEAAERHGVKIVLSIFAVGFTPGDAWKGWEENPYSAARGGPASSPAEFFTGGAAREAARRRLRYVLARWSASPALLSVDLLNEPEWDGAIAESAWIPWAQDLARTWCAEDAYRHPVSAGPVGLHWNVERDERAGWASAGCDVVQWHRGPDVYDVHALAGALVATARDTARYGKPVLVGEFAWGGEAKPGYDHTHVGLWASTFAGAGVLAHSAPPFTVDSDEPMTPDRALHFRTLAAFLARAEAREALRPGPEPRTSVPGLRALALGGESTVALWVHAPRLGYGTAVRGAAVTVAGLAPGRWRVTWIDDVSGEELAREERSVRTRASLPVPPFTRHVAALLERTG
jgi:hypothetical protein